MPKTAFEHVVREHGVTVLRMTRSMLPAVDADDAWSETFLAALRNYPALPTDANVEAWLVTIARRKAIDILRADGRHAAPMAELPEQLSSIGIPGTEDLDLARALTTLPTKQRRAVTLHYLAGLPHQQVAAELGGTPDAARRAAADGIAALRRAYAPGTHIFTTRQDPHR